MQLREIAEQLLRLADSKEAEIPAIGPWQAEAPSSFDPVEVARFLYRSRAERAGYFDADLLGEPGWDMLLDLYIARAAGKDVPTISLCHAARVAQTTGLRWIGYLEEAGLVERFSAPHDGRVTNVRMSSEGAKRMRNFLQRFSACDTISAELRLIRSL